MKEKNTTKMDRDKGQEKEEGQKAVVGDRQRQ